MGHEGTINDVKFSPCGTKIVTSSADKSAKVCDIENGEMLWSSATFDSYITSVSFHPNERCLAIGGYGNEIMILFI